MGGDGDGREVREGEWLKGARRGSAGVGVGVGVGVAGRGNRFRLERFGKAMTGSCAWDPPGGLLNGLSPFSPIPPSTEREPLT